MTQRSNPRRYAPLTGFPTTNPEIAMTLFQRLGRALGHPTKTYFYHHWATAQTTRPASRRP